MINNVRFKIIAGKINKIPEFYTIFARKICDYNNDNEIEARPRPRPKFSPGGQLSVISYHKGAGLYKTAP